MKRTELYNREKTMRMMKSSRAWRVALFVFIGASLAFCITMLAITTTKNVSTTRPVVFIFSAIAGSVAIYVAAFPVAARRREADHANNMLSGEESVCRGTLTVSKQKTKIRSSITVRRVTVDGETTEHLNVNAALASLLPSDGREYTVYSVHGYVTGIEEVSGD